MAEPVPLDSLRSSYRHVRDPRHQRVLRVQAALGSAIRAYLDDLDRGRFPYRPTWSCGFCGYRENQCAAWRG